MDRGSIKDLKRSSPFPERLAGTLNYYATVGIKVVCIRVASLDGTSPPILWEPVEKPTTEYPPVTFNDSRTEYGRVCGRVKGYQYGPAIVFRVKKNLSAPITDDIVVRLYCYYFLTSHWCSLWTEFSIQSVIILIISQYTCTFTWNCIHIRAYEYHVHVHHVLQNFRKRNHRECGWPGTQT